ncbi:unnamed protein product [Calicophoron daubneyi]|uniref:Uncharacterized protein n=1 Tax=Calicophoron daubneyi TaxID=300641 RepID=A0AAV2T6D6_CALDB
MNVKEGEGLQLLKRPAAQRGRYDTRTNVQGEENDRHEKSFVPLYRYLYMNDRNDTQIFTFLILPQLLCGTFRTVKSTPFIYAHHSWIVRFQRSETHLGAFLELRPESCFGHHSDENSTVALKQPAVPLQRKSVSIDFQFVLRNREHFSQNEVLRRESSLFRNGQLRHGSKRFVELISLSSRKFLYDDGKCIVDLEIKNPSVILTLRASQCKDPIDSSPFDNVITSSNTNKAISLMRLDGTVVTVRKSMHFETEEFPYFDAHWYLSLDIEPRQSLEHRDNTKRSSVSSTERDSLNISAVVEITIVRQGTRADSRARRCALPQQKQPNSCYHIVCSAELPGSCFINQMEFSISPQGWPLRAHRTEFGSGLRNQAQSHVPNNIQNSDGGSEMPQSPTGSPTALLLASCTSAFTVNLTMINFSKVALVEIPVTMNANEKGEQAIFFDPFQMPWSVRTLCTAKLLRLQIRPETERKYGPKSHSADRSRHRHRSLFRLPNGCACLLGCQLKITPVVPNIHASINTLGRDLAQLIRFSSRGKKCHSNCTLHDHFKEFSEVANGPEREIEEEDAELPTLCSHSDSCDENVEKQLLTTSELCEKLQDTCQIAMNVAVSEVLDTNTGIMNPMNRTLLAEVEWVYNQLIYIETVHPADAVSGTHFYQMRNELNILRKERDELERQLMMKEMGLVQVDTSVQGPKSLLPKESLSAFSSASDQLNRVGSIQQPEPQRQSTAPISRYPCPSPAPYPQYRTTNLSKSEYSVSTEEILQRKPAYSSPRETYSMKPRISESLGNEYSCYPKSGTYGLKTQRQSMEYEPGLAATQAGLSTGGSSKIDLTYTRLPERRKQFGRSKTTWETCESAREQQLSSHIVQPVPQNFDPDFCRVSSLKLISEPTSNPNSAVFSNRSTSDSPGSPYYEEYDEPIFFRN